MRIMCRRKSNGRFVVESDAGDVFEYQVAVRAGTIRMRRVGPPVWRPGPWPVNTDAIASAARRAALARARHDGFAV